MPGQARSGHVHWVTCRGIKSHWVSIQLLTKQNCRVLSEYGWPRHRHGIGLCPYLVHQIRPSGYSSQICASHCLMYKGSWMLDLGSWIALTADIGHKSRLNSAGHSRRSSRRISDKTQNCQRAWSFPLTVPGPKTFICAALRLTSSYHADKSVALLIWPIPKVIDGFIIFKTKW